MESARMRVVVDGRHGAYHLISRTACSRRIFGDQEKENIVRIMRRQAAFCGVDILSYCIMSDHFHILARVRYQEGISDEEFRSRYLALYEGQPKSPKVLQQDELDFVMTQGGEEKASFLGMTKARMGNISSFMRELKQRIGIMYNATHDNSGTIWAERFKGVIVELSQHTMALVAAYIDLNPVRAELVNDPADYRFCSYGAAMAGDELARAGYVQIFDGQKWSSLIRDYRMLLFGRGDKLPDTSGEGGIRITLESLQERLDNREKIEIPVLLRRKVRYFCDGYAIGSKAYLDAFFEQHRSLFSQKRKVGFVPMKAADWGDVGVMRNLRLSVFG